MHVSKIFGLYLLIVSFLTTDMVCAQGLTSSQADFLVSSKHQFLTALEKAKEGQIIYIQDEAEIDLTNERMIMVPNGVTIASGRGMNGSKGGMIFTDVPAYPFIVCGSDVTFYGIRVKGADTAKYHNGKVFTGPNAVRLNMYKNPVSQGITTSSPNLKIENCELYGWTHSAVFIETGAVNAILVNNYIHHNRRYGLGYGITVDGGHALIKSNVFDYNRHDIAGTGIPGSGYEATKNKFLEHTYSHSVDMHGGKDRKDNTNIAGTLIKVYDNEFRRFDKSRAVLIRGIPQKGAFIHNNRIQIVPHANRAVGVQSRSQKSISNVIQQINAKGKVEVYENTIN